MPAADEFSITGGREKSKHACLLTDETPTRTTVTGLDQAKCPTVSTDVAVVLLFTLAGFLIGGAYTTWKTTRPLAIALGVAAALAAAAAVLWLL